MILIADSGSTKTDWVVLKDGKNLFETATVGLNPIFNSKKEIQSVLRSVNLLRDFNRKISVVRFFGAGCGTKKEKEKIESTLKTFFPFAKANVQTDLMGAAMAVCGKESGIVCILGTGSNCCYYDGKKIHQGNSGLGYILGDEAGGTYFGRKILTKFLYGKLTGALAKDFKKQFQVTRESVIDNTYNQPNANKYLASFAAFVIKWKENEEMQEMIMEGLNDFYKTNISMVKNYQKLPVNFVGSVAFHLKEFIVQLCKERSLVLGKIIQSPIEGLEDYFSKHS